MSASPYLTRSEAAEWLRCSVDTVDRISVPMAEGQADGKIRYLIVTIGSVRRVRILRDDVLAILPQVEAA